MQQPVRPARPVGVVWRGAKVALMLGVLGVGALLFAGAAALRSLVVRDDGGIGAQRWFHTAVRFFLFLSERLGLLRVRVEGAEALRGPGARLVVANHPSSADVLALVSRVPQLDCIVKPSWARHPFMGRAARAADYLAGDGAGVVAQATARLADGRSVLVFPEGTRSPEQGVHRFQRGAAHMALRSGCDLLPVVITCEPPGALGKGWRWWAQPEGGVTIRARVHPAISPKASLAGGETHSVAVRAVTADLQGFFEEKLGFVD